MRRAALPFLPELRKRFGLQGLDKRFWIHRHKLGSTIGGIVHTASGCEIWTRINETCFLFDDVLFWTPPILRVAFPVLQTHMSGFLHHDDLWATKLASNSLHQATRRSTFDINKLSNTDPKFLCKMFKELLKKRLVRPSTVFFLAAKLFPVSSLQVFLTRGMGARLIRRFDIVASRQACQAVAVTNDIKKFHLVRAFCYQYWVPAAITCVRNNSMAVLKTLFKYGELRQETKDQLDEIAIEAGTLLELESLQDLIMGSFRWRQSVVAMMAVAAVGRMSGLEMVWPFQVDDPELQAMEMTTAVIFNQVNVVRYLYGKGVAVNLQVVGAIPCGNIASILRRYVKHEDGFDALRSWFRSEGLEIMEVDGMGWDLDEMAEEVGMF